MGDADAVFAYASDAAVTRYLTITPRSSVDEVVPFLEWCNEAWDAGTSFPLAIVTRSDDKFVGIIEARVTDHGIELGYALHQSAWGNGYMPEAIQGVVQWAFGHDDVHRVWAYVDVANAASRRTLEKVGMTREGHLHSWQVHPNNSPQPADCYLYAVWR
jgi:RimJ/RimL family protein N-acetyltransferase